MRHSRCPRNPAVQRAPRSLEYVKSLGVSFSCDISFAHRGSRSHQHDACETFGAERRTVFNAGPWKLTLYFMTPGLNATCAFGRSSTMIATTSMCSGQCDWTPRRCFNYEKILTLR